jgi:DNA helicase-2/ATP-dependent DNA helicase PcrA
MSETFDVKAFVNERDNVLIAPAGFGKTHTISECLKHTEGKQLILTHTQAGVASIKDKLQKSLISKEKYSVETISSFAQRYVYSFYNSVIPDETDENFYPFFLEKSTEILSLKLVQDIVKISYQQTHICLVCMKNPQIKQKSKKV